jgi:hypothetical protein
MTNSPNTIISKQMRILFKGQTSYVKKDHYSEIELRTIRDMDIELLKSYLPHMDEQSKSRALKTIHGLEIQLNNASEKNY